MCAAMKSTAEASSGWSIQTVQISPVVTGTGLIALDALDERDQLVDRLFRAQRGFVADHDRVDVAVAARELDGGLDFPLVAVFVLVDPDAERDLQAELGGDRRHQFDAAGRANRCGWRGYRG